MKYFAYTALIASSSAIQLEYIDGSHPVDLYETNGADSNRDHKTAQIPAAMRGKEQQGWESAGNSHYWATEGAARQSGWSNEINPWTQKLDFRSGDDMQKSKSTYTSLSQYIDGSHPVDLYETNGADSNRDHKTAQIPAAMRGKEQQGWESAGNSHYWATEGAARQSGWSNEINPWTQKLDFRSGDDMQKSKSTYTSLSQYIDGSHPVDLYETNGADSNRDHKTAQIPAAMRGKEQQGWQSPGNSHYWATEGAARQSGWSNEINPWTQKLDFRSGDDMQKSKSTYTSLYQNRY